MDLTILGLSENESKTYQALIRHGSASAALAAKESGVPYGKIYQVLDRLEAKGLVRIAPEPTKKFIPADPKTVIKLIESKEQELKKLKEEANELKTEYNYHGTDPVQIVRGKKNFYKIVRATESADNFSYSIKYTSEFNPEFLRNFNRAKKRGIDERTLTRVDKETIPNIKKWLKHHNDIKEINNSGVALGISDKRVMLVLINQNIIMTIKDEAFQNVMKDLFEAYYNQAPELNI